MTVKELIIKLLDLDPEEDVYVDENLAVTDVINDEGTISILTESEN